MRFLPIRLDAHKSIRLEKETKEVDPANIWMGVYKELLLCAHVV